MTAQSSAASTLIMVAGDLHIGTASTRVWGKLDSELTSTACVWQRLVEEAIRRKTTVLLLTGDLVNENHQFWASLGPLEQGLQRLNDYNIQVIAVAGNHDPDVISRLADSVDVPNFTLLGRNGTWERKTIYDAEGGAVCRVDGWSFPTERVTDDPVEDYPAAESSLPVLGMVHGDLGQKSSNYAPLSEDNLRRCPVDAWLLGHIHSHQLIRPETGARWILYAGSAQALDPGEPGVHGVWVLSFRNGQLDGEPQAVPISSVRYEQRDIDLNGIDREEQIEAELLSQVRGHVNEMIEHSGPYLQLVSLRLRLIGRTPLVNAVPGRVQRLTEGKEEIQVQNVAVVVDRVFNQLRSPVDLDEYAQGRAPPGVVARLLQELDAEEPSAQTCEFIERVRRRLESIQRSRDFLEIEDNVRIDEDLVRDMLKRQGDRLLAELIDQQAE